MIAITTPTYLTFPPHAVQACRREPTDLIELTDGSLWSLKKGPMEYNHGVVWRDHGRDCATLDLTHTRTVYLKLTVVSGWRYERTSGNVTTGQA